MSLILEALRKADAERDRGTVPGLHAQSAVTEAVMVPARKGFQLWHGGVIGLSVVLFGALLWWVVGRDAPPGSADTVSRQPMASLPNVVAHAGGGPGARGPAGSASAISSDAGVPPSANNPPNAPDSDAATAAGPAPWPSIAPPRPQTANAVPAAATPTAATSTTPTAPTSIAPTPAATSAGTSLPSTPASATAAASTATSPATIAADDPVAVYALEQLPAKVREQLPALNFGGSIFSSSAANRSVIVNGRLFHEQEELSAGLTLEQIRAKSVVLRFRGYRFEARY